MSCTVCLGIGGYEVAGRAVLTAFDGGPRRTRGFGPRARLFTICLPADEKVAQRKSAP